jgi:hypothetical protein
MDYKRQLGHRIYPRHAFLAKLKQHRGAFRPTDISNPSTGRFPGVLKDGEECDVLGALGWDQPMKEATPAK